jgi:DNA-3-methyladenine glycosylase II
MNMDSFLINTPAEFNFGLCLDYLKRSPKEVLHRCGESHVTKLLRFNTDEVLFELTSPKKNRLQVTLLNQTGPNSIRENLENYIHEWFDLGTDLKPFYLLAKKDLLLRDLAKKFFGYRIVGQPDLFESLIWAVLGQQINVQFAYTLKQRFVEQFGEKLLYGNETFYLFPKPETVALLKDDNLLPLQFSRQKSKYVILIAEAFESGEVSKEKLTGLSLEEAKEQLIKIKGIGNWTANYALMKTFHYLDAFPLEDVGIHNAIKNLKGMKAKPTLAQVKRIFKKYKGWEAYATLYLWKSL